MLCVFGMSPCSYDTNVCFGVVSRLAYAAGLIVNHHLVLLWSHEGGGGSLAWEVARGMLLLSVKILRVC